MDKKVDSSTYLKQLRERRAQRRALTGTANPTRQAQPAKTSALPVRRQQTPERETARPTVQTAPTRQDKSAEVNREGQKTNQRQASTQNVELPDVTIQESRVAPGLYKPLPEQTIYEWKAPSRPFKKRKKQFFSTVFIITLLIFLILVFIGQWLAGAVAVSVAFLIYVLSVIPPQEVTNKLTTYGIKVEDMTHYWEELGRFWYEKKADQELLNIETLRFPGRIALLIGKASKEHITEILSEVLLNKKPDLTFYDKTAKWLQEKIPLET